MSSVDELSRKLLASHSQLKSPEGNCLLKRLFFDFTCIPTCYFEHFSISDVRYLRVQQLLDTIMDTLAPATTTQSLPRGAYSVLYSLTLDFRPSSFSG